jgi:hypothetical protein
MDVRGRFSSRWALPASVVFCTYAFVSLQTKHQPSSHYADASQTRVPHGAVSSIFNDSPSRFNDFDEIRPLTSTYEMPSIQAAPHIILFTVDDLGWNDVGMYSTDIPKATPFITSLAKKGVTLSRYYAQPSCTPSRVTIMTAKFAHRNGFQNYDMQHVDQVSMLCPFI